MEKEQNTGAFNLNVDVVNIQSVVEIDFVVIDVVVIEVVAIEVVEIHIIAIDVVAIDVVEIDVGAIDVAVPSSSSGRNNNNRCQSSNSTPVTNSPMSTPSSVGSNCHPLTLSYTPNGSEEWIRRVELEFMPTIGRAFGKLEEGVQFYDIYALACGFTPRLYTTKRLRDGTIYKKSIVCNRQGFMTSKLKKEPHVVDNPSDEKSKPKHQKEQKTKITRIGCQAKVRFVLNEARTHYVIDQLQEAHNHALCSLKYREFNKIVRNLSLYHKQMIIDHSKLNIGPSKTFRISKEYAKGFPNIGASLTEFKNFQRDVKCFIGFKDASMFIKLFEELAETENFYFAYEVDEEKSLTRVFWADETARNNYALFGDGFSYDPTYGTNKYSMVFSPFTGVDNHKKSVTFGAALMADEDESSFRWVFKKFLDAMSNKEPQFVITDQDPAIKNAVRGVFKNATHRLCMWHIMQKIPKKVGAVICDETDFLSKFSALVWNDDLLPSEFEEMWKDIINEHELSESSWLNHMFKIRQNWIPAFSRDISMGCLLRTTQRSESSNSFFKRFENKHGTLVEFWMRFRSAMEQQRHTQKRLDSESKHSLPKTITPLKLEIHAAQVYTHTLFYEFQDELRIAMCYSGVEGFSKSGNLEITDVRDGSKNRMFQVEYNCESVEAMCSCKLFQRVGQLCSHIIKVFAGKSLKEIPEQYIKKRWTKDVNDNSVCNDGGKVIRDSDEHDVRKVELSKVWSEFYRTLDVIARMPDVEVKELASVLRQFREKLNPTGINMSKEEELKMLLGCADVTSVNILPPNKANNKGSGKKENQPIKSSPERPKRRCRNCKQMVNHDRRNCPNPYVDSEDDNNSEADVEDALEETIAEQLELIAEERNENAENDNATHNNNEDQVPTKRPKRRCRNCKKIVNHDRRNCPNPFVDSEDDSEGVLNDALQQENAEKDEVPTTRERIQTRQQTLRSK